MSRRINIVALVFVIAVFTTALTLAQTPTSDETATPGFVTQLQFIGQEPYDVNDSKGTRFKLSVTNRAAHPDFLWAPTAKPCGKNEISSRTWVEIFGSPGNKRLAGFCSLRSSEDLGHLWFPVPSGAKGPQCVYIVMTDQRTGKRYTSNRVCSRLFTVVTGSLKAGGQQEAGGFGWDRISAYGPGNAAPDSRTPSARIDVADAQATAPRGWDPKKKTGLAGSSETSQGEASAGDTDRPVIVGRIPNNNGNVPGGPGFDSVRSLGSLSFNFNKLELARETTLRVYLTNRLVLKRQEDDPPRVYALVKLYDSTGQVITQSQKVSLPWNQVHGVTFNRSAIPLPGEPREARVQIRVVVEVEVQTTDRNTTYVNTAGGGVWASLKVTDNVSGKSTASPSGQVSDPRILYIGTGETNNGGTGRDQISSFGSGNNSTSVKPTNKGPRAALPDLVVKQFLFPPTNDKALRVQVSNDGSAASGASRLIITVRKINGTAVGRQTHVNIPALAPGKKVWLVIDANGILPNNVALQSTTFKLNADGTEIVAESDENNNEVWHNL